MLENSTNVGNFCGDKKFLLWKFFLIFVVVVVVVVVVVIQDS